MGWLGAAGCLLTQTLGVYILSHFASSTALCKKRRTYFLTSKAARWKIENETFNTLKNQGYHFEHNFGHGNKHLSAVFASLMLLAFLIDQIQQRCCPLFRQAQQKKKSKVNLWESLRGLFLNHLIPHWEALLCAMAYGIKVDEPIAYNTS